MNSEKDTENLNILPLENLMPNSDPDTDETVVPTDTATDAPAQTVSEPQQDTPKKRRGRPPKKKVSLEDSEPESKKDKEIGDDLYNLYIETLSHPKDEAVSIDLFDAIGEEEPQAEEILPNTAYIDGDEENQIAFSDNFEDFEEADECDEVAKDESDSLPPYDEKKPRKIDSRFDFAELFIFTLLAVMILTSFIFKHSIVDGGSMLNTLESGEHLIISDLFYTPSQGDIIVCEDYSTGIRKPIVKRVIAVGGDYLEISRYGYVCVNGEMLSEEYVFIDGDFRYPEVSMFIPDGMIYVMGDHRNASTDSRNVGCIDEDAVLGKVLLRFYPFDKFGTVD